jgi:hypothetical protein
MSDLVFPPAPFKRVNTQIHYPGIESCWHTPDRGFNILQRYSLSLTFSAAYQISPL